MKIVRKIRKIKRFKNMVKLALIGSAMLGLSGCEKPVENQETAYTEELMAQANDEIGMPDITKFY